MAGLTLTKKREWAKLLYIQSNKTQKEIANTVGITEKTLGNWIKKEKWEELKAIDTITKIKERKRLLMQINELNNKIETREPGNKFPDSKEADVLSKLSATVNNLDSNTPLNVIIDVLTNFLDWSRNIDFKETQRIADLFDSYIKTKLNEE